MAESFGDGGKAWLADLPLLIDRVRDEWSIEIGRAFEDASVSWVAPVTLADGSPAVVKIGIPHREACYEGRALRVFDGRGAVRLLRATEDDAALLLERCIPGTNLWDVEAEAGIVIAGDVLRQLWRPVPTGTFESLEELAREWSDTLAPTRLAHGYDKRVVDAALRLGAELAASQPDQMLLHGDFQPFNILAAEREPWLAIDCKPLAGDPAFDLAQYLGDLAGVTAGRQRTEDTLRAYVHEFAEQLSLDPLRIAGWAFVKSVGWDWGMPTASLLRRVAGAH